MKRVLAFVLCSVLLLPGNPAAGQPVRAEHLCTIDRRYPNDGDCHGDLFFQFHSQNQVPEGDFHGVTVANLRTGETLAFVPLGFNPNFHNSSLTFVHRKENRKDRFPLLYASENYAPNEYYKILVYRIMDGYVPEVRQIITMPSPDSLGILFPHAVPDEDGRHLWIEAYSADQSETVFLEFDLPAFLPGTETTLGTPLRSFRIPRKTVTDQSWCMRKNKFYQVVGVRRESWLRIIDKRTGTLEKEFNLTEAGLPYEPEAIFFWKGRLCISFSHDGKAEIYRIKY